MKKKLRIATMVTGHYTTPPPKEVVYAPMDIAVEVSQGLVKRGHEVTFFAPVGSKIKGVKVESGGLKPLAQKFPFAKDPKVGGAEMAKLYNLWDQYLIALIYQGLNKGRFDLAHIHPIDRALPLALAQSAAPTFYTLHDPIYHWRGKIFEMFASKNQHLISISNAQRKPFPYLNYAATVYNGVDLNEFSFSDKEREHFIFVGRILPEKGVAEAVQAALLAGEKLLIVGKAEGDYWEKGVKPFLGEKIQHAGFVPRNKLYKYYQKAKAILVPIQWEEPFGLVMTEAMACGTPVIGWRRASVPEVVADGETGYVVNSVAEMAAAMKKIGNISRRACRERVEKYFSTEKMVDGYEKVFYKILGTRN